MADCVDAFVISLLFSLTAELSHKKAHIATKNHIDLESAAYFLHVAERIAEGRSGC